MEALEDMRTFVQLLLGPTGFTAHSSEESPPGGPPARVPDGQASLLIRGAIYTVLFKKLRWDHITAAWPENA